MPNLTADETVMQRHKRAFIQVGGPLPANGAQYYGQDAQWLSIEGVSAPETGGVEPVWVHDPSRINGYRLVNRKISPADLPSASLKLWEKHGAIPRQLAKQSCQFNLYEPTGNCKDLSDFLGGWTDYVLIYSGAIVTDKDLGTRVSFMEDESVEDTLSITLAYIYPIGGLAFGEQAGPEIDREVAEAIYASLLSCGDCGAQDDGTKRIYAVTKSSGAGSPGLPAEVVYSLDGEAGPWLEATITGIGADADPVAIRIINDRLLVLVPSENAYYWATLNEIGVPGAFTKVTTGFVTNKNPRDVYVASPREIYFCGDGGYIYKATDIAAGVTVINAGSTTTENLQRIDGQDETIVAVGNNSTVIVSLNRGSTFATTNANPSALAVTISAVEVLGKNTWWVGTENTGRFLYTNNGGFSWTEKSFSGAGVGTVNDIKFVTPEVGYFVHTNTTPTARLFSTWDGGNSWTNAKPRILNFPTFSRCNRIGVPLITDNPGLASNKIALAGLSGGGTDGVLYFGVAPFI